MLRSRLTVLMPKCTVSPCSVCLVEGVSQKDAFGRLPNIHSWACEALTSPEDIWHDFGTGGWAELLLSSLEERRLPKAEVHLIYKEV